MGFSFNVSQVHFPSQKKRRKCQKKKKNLVFKRKRVLNSFVLNLIQLE